MKLVVWNCDQGLHRKSEALLGLKADIAVVPKAARQARTVVQKASGSLWVGEEKNKGLGVYAFNGYQVKLHEAYDKQLQWVAPVVVSGPKPFLLFAVWAMQHWATEFHPDQRKRAQVEVALEVYARLIQETKLPLVVAGDFNSCPAWDAREKTSRHANTLRALKEQGLVSAYHAARGVEHGQEPEPTLYWRDRTKNGPRYHIDFCFVPEAWAGGLGVTVGSFEDWVEENLSDHAPLSVEIGT